MKNIVCFGDSNTWGYDAVTCERFDENTRWTALLQKKLNDSGFDVNIIEEGHNGRTTGFDDPTKDGRNGFKSLSEILKRDKQYDLFIIMLGTNDCKIYYRLAPSEFKTSLQSLVTLIKKERPDADILLIATPDVREGIDKINYKYDSSSMILAREIRRIYKEVADENSLNCIYADDAAHSSDYDLQHLNADGHKKLAEYISEYLKENYL